MCIRGNSGVARISVGGAKSDTRMYVHGLATVYNNNCAPFTRGLRVYVPPGLFSGFLYGL